MAISGIAMNHARSGRADRTSSRTKKQTSTHATRYWRCHKVTDGLILSGTNLGGVTMVASDETSAALVGEIILITTMGRGTNCAPTYTGTSTIAHSNRRSVPPTATSWV